jgi:hypothetical protein
MPQCQFPVFCYFCVLEKLHRKYSQNWTKQKPNLLIFTEASRRSKRRWRGVTGQPHHRAAWAAPGPRPIWVRPPWPTLDDVSSPIKTPHREKPMERIAFPRNILQAAAVVESRSGGSKSSSRHPAGGLLHHHGRLRSDV